MIYDQYGVAAEMRNRSGKDTVSSSVVGIVPTALFCSHFLESLIVECCIRGMG